MATQQDDIIEIPEVNVNATPISLGDELAKSTIKLLKGYLEIHERAKKGENITAKDFNKIENEYNNEVRPLQEAAKKLPKSELDAAIKESDEITGKWQKENPGAMNEIKDVAALNEAFKRSYINNAPPKNTSLLPDTHSTEELLVDLLKKNPGIAIADIYQRSPSADTIASNIKALKKAGLDTVYIPYPEGLDKYKNMSASELKEEINKISPEIINNTIDEKYKRYPKSVGMDNYFAAPLQESEKSNGEILKLFLAAKENGIRVINIEKPDTVNKIESDLEGHRVASTNFTWVQNIKDDQESRPPGSKFVVFGGYGNFNPTKEDTIGLVAKSLGITVVSFDNRETNSKAPIKPGKSANGPDFFLPGGSCHPNTPRLAYAADFDGQARDGISPNSSKTKAEHERIQVRYETKYLDCDQSGNLVPSPPPPGSPAGKVMGK